MNRTRQPDTHIVHLRPAGDPVFFAKADLLIGSVLTYYGRHDPGSQWRVERIRHYTSVNGQYRGQFLKRVEFLSDEIWLVRVGSRTGAKKPRGNNRHMQLSFDYLSYSAIWRLS